MQFSSTFLAVAILTNSAFGVDCTDFSPWVPSVYATRLEQHHKDNILWTNTQYADLSEAPGVSPIWSNLGTCDPGTAGDGITVDCSTFETWSEKIYLVNSDVQYNGRYFRSAWYANPNNKPESNQVWVYHGICGSESSEGSTTSVAPSTTSVVASTTTAGSTAAASASTASTTTIASTTIASTTIASTTAATTAISTTSSPSTSTGSWPARFFAPFQDATLSKRASWTDLKAATGTRYFALGFIVAASGSCTPSWGGYYSVAEMPWSSFMTDLSALRAVGGDVIISFGGASNTELANAAACQTGTPAENLKSAYASVVDTYALTAIDFDIEGSFIDLTYRNTAWKYRFDAVNLLTADRPNLRVSWTFPVLPTGLLDSALTFVGDLMTYNVRFDHINIMTMNYGTYNCPGDMSGCEIQAIQSLASQVYQKAVSLGKASTYGWSSVNDVYKNLGSTPMIGVNDVNDHTYYLDDARTSLATWQSSYPIGWLSQWSVARDSPCANQWADPTCSGKNVQTVDYEFMSIFAPYTSA